MASVEGVDAESGERQGEHPEHDEVEDANVQRGGLRHREVVGRGQSIVLDREVRPSGTVEGQGDAADDGGAGREQGRGVEGGGRELRGHESAAPV
ncbi:MAG: hypothetical protein ACLT43_11035 [Collinsella sp.]